MNYEDFIKNERECAEDKLHNLLRSTFFYLHNSSAQPFEDNPHLETYFPQLSTPEGSTLNFPKNYFAVSGNKLLLYQDNVIKQEISANITHMAISPLEEFPYLLYGGEYNSLDYLKISNIIEPSEEKTISLPRYYDGQSAINSLAFFEDKLFISHSSHGIIFLPLENIYTSNNIQIDPHAHTNFLHKKNSHSKILRMCSSPSQLFFSEDEQLYAYSSKKGKTECSHYPSKITSLFSSNADIYVGCENGSIHKNKTAIIPPNSLSPSAVKKIRPVMVDSFEGILYTLHQQPHLFFMDTKNRETKFLSHPLATIIDFDYNFKQLLVLNSNTVIIQNEENLGKESNNKLLLDKDVMWKYICSYGGN
ncbi:hypothetical protein HYX11_04605 [Candidatus Woesearchaeota archaeon]|nr:hypothetical protein [Candidatus Woesearchaeota archaeon]